jgi:myosin-crossreactive antigen
MCLFTSEKLWNNIRKKSRNLGQPERHSIPNKSLRRPEIISLKLENPGIENRI